MEDQKIPTPWVKWCRTGKHGVGNRKKNAVLKCLKSSHVRGIPEPDAAQQAIFDQGHAVGALDKSLYPGGIEISADVTGFESVLQQSLEATKARKPLFEAAFVYNGGFARNDILNPVGKDAWDIIHVKSSEGKNGAGRGCPEVDSAFVRSAVSHKWRSLILVGTTRSTLYR